MKKWSMLLIMVCIFISLCGCSGKEKIENKAENKVEAKVEAKKDAWNVTSYEELEDIEYISELEVDSESISNASVKTYEITYNYIFNYKTYLKNHQINIILKINYSIILSLF